MVNEPPRIEFPCAYPLKIILVSGDMRVSEVIAIVQEHAPEADELDAELVPSRNGRYGSVRMTINATGEPQLKSIHRDLMALDYVKMVL